MQSRILNAIRNRAALALGALAALVFAALLGIACESPEVSAPLPKESAAAKMGASTVNDSAAVSPISDMTYKIAFMSWRDGNPEIYTADADGGNIKRVTFTPLFHEIPADWSPDGNMISYSMASRESLARRSIFTTNADGSNQRPILEEPGNSYSSPKFSPDGREVVFVSNRGGNYNIYTIGIDGGNPQQITFSENSVFSPDWSPDGRQIAYHSERDGNRQIYLLDIQSGDERKVTSGLADNGLPTFSPDGKNIAYHSISGDITELFVLDLATLESRQITRFGKDPCCASWSPDGKIIYFQMWGEDGYSNIYRISPDGGFPEAIIQSEFYDGFVVVSPFIER